ncbi:MAG: replication-relaxation family protein [Chloroflexi bacterium]|nr:replication-relaxation family protein [Chloroflexota bacterium]MBV9543647.1 replication-relaxation family protein [Chloroflexota bacterium]
MRTMAHTLGTHAVFVALHVALSRSPGDGLIRWDNAAASMRGRCRPDGYGVCRVRGHELGFFLEYDRGTESARDYAAKWAGYHAYRDSGRAAADYASFPTILLVTEGSEQRVLRSAGAAAVGRPDSALPIRVTSTGWIEGHPRGILGPIWRSADSQTRGFWVCDPLQAGYSIADTTPG